MNQVGLTLLAELPYATFSRKKETQMIKGVVFDLDGTLYLGEKVIPGAVDVVLDLESRGYRVFYLTNNSGRTQWQIIEKLNAMGFRANGINVYCGSYAISMYLDQNHMNSVYVIGTDSLKAELESCDIKISDSRLVQAVVVGLDPLFDYRKIAEAMEAIDEGAKLIVANTDASYPVEDGRRLPGCGAMVGAIVATTGHTPDFHVGKPNVYMLELLCNEQSLSPTEICMVGDSPESDMQMAVDFGCQSILFDPDGAFPNFSGRRVREMHDVVSLI